MFVSGKGVNEGSWGFSLIVDFDLQSSLFNLNPCFHPLAPGVQWCADKCLKIVSLKSKNENV